MKILDKTAKLFAKEFSHHLTTGQQIEMTSEEGLKTYLLVARGQPRTRGLGEFWTRSVEEVKIREVGELPQSLSMRERNHMQAFFHAVTPAMLIQPSSAAAERVFSLLQKTYGKHVVSAKSTSVVVREANIMRQYNRRGGGSG